MIQLRKILMGVGLTLIIPGLMALVSIPVCLIFEEYNEIYGFLFTALPALIIGGLCFWMRPKQSYHIIELMIVLSLGWLAVTLIGTIPFIQQGYNQAEVPQAADITNFRHFINAFFESVSGFTSTGLTMVEDEAWLTHSLQWWRTFMQWIGGIGIVVMVTFFHNPRLYSADQYYEKDDFADILPNANTNFYNYWWIYLVFTAVSVLILWISKVPVWEAVNHGMTGMATGGFTVTSDSYASYNSTVKFTSIFIMLLGCLSFNLFYRLLKHGKWKAFITNTQVIVFFVIFGIGFLIVGTTSRGISWVDALFQFSSALATCGFQSNSIQQWNIVPVLILSLVMMIGGTTDSTTGGIKIFRFWIFLKSIFMNASRVLFNPNRALKIHLQEKRLNVKKRNRELLADTYIYLLLWLFVYIVCTIILAHILQDQWRFRDIIFETSSAFGNVGMSSGITGPDLEIGGKALIILIMFAGRLELMPLMIILGLLFRKREEEETRD